MRAAIKARVDGFLFGQNGRNPRRRRGPACGRDSLELKLSRYGPFVGCVEYPDCGYRRSLSAAAAEDEGYAGPRELGSDQSSVRNFSAFRQGKWLPPARRTLLARLIPICID